MTRTRYLETHHVRRVPRDLPHDGPPPLRPVEAARRQVDEAVYGGGEALGQHVPLQHAEAGAGGRAGAGADLPAPGEGRRGQVPAAQLQQSPGGAASVPRCQLPVRDLQLPDGGLVLRVLAPPAPRQLLRAAAHDGEEQLGVGRGGEVLAGLAALATCTHHQHHNTGHWLVDTCFTSRFCIS